jgi:uncharacterized protein YbjT (DUF2867 family)
MSQETIAVLGATGNVGRQVVAQLLEAGQRVRVVTRDERKIADWGSRVERVVGEIGDHATIARALDGVRKLFAFSFLDAPPEVDQRIIQHASRCGVRHVVKLSTIGASSDIGIGKLHREREQWIERSGLSFTFLRPGFFMSNALRWTATVKEQGRVFTPVPDGLTAPISARDVAEVARLALLSPGQEGKIYELTGGELLSAREQVKILSQVLERPIECVEIPVERVLENQRKAGQPAWLLESVGRLWADVGAGRGGFRTETLSALTGHAPERFEAWCREHRAAFVGS